jgi:hypothetical protein
MPIEGTYINNISNIEAFDNKTHAPEHTTGDNKIHKLKNTCLLRGLILTT